LVLPRAKWRYNTTTHIVKLSISLSHTHTHAHTHTKVICWFYRVSNGAIILAKSGDLMLLFRRVAFRFFGLLRGLRLQVVRCVCVSICVAVLYVSVAVFQCDLILLFRRVAFRFFGLLRGLCLQIVRCVCVVVCVAVLYVCVALYLGLSFSLSLSLSPSLPLFLSLSLPPFLSPRTRA